MMNNDIKLLSVMTSISKDEHVNFFFSKDKDRKVRDEGRLLDNRERNP